LFFTNRPRMVRLLVSAAVGLLIVLISAGIDWARGDYEVITSWQQAPAFMRERAIWYAGVVIAVPILAVLVVGGVARRASVSWWSSSLVVVGVTVLSSTLFSLQIGYITEEIDPELYHWPVGWLCIVLAVPLTVGAVIRMFFEAGHTRVDEVSTTSGRFEREE
jgi:hypothetical protein